MAGESAKMVHIAPEPTASSSMPEIGVVDDDTSVLRALHLFLKVAGFRVATFTSAEDFLRSEDLERVQCLVLDVQLGGMSGFDLSDYLAASQRRIPLIFVTAHADAQTRERAKRAGAVEYLRKPFDEDVLVRAIRKAVGGDG